MKNAWIWIVVAIVVIGGGYWWLQGLQAPAVSDDGTPAAVDAANVAATVDVNAAPMTATVTFDGTSYSPASVTIKQGGSVTFTSTAGNMWVASAPHPAHTGYDGTDRSTHCATGYTGAAPFDQCVAGTSYTFTFNKVGTWKYHNHSNSSAFGSVTVVQ